MQHWIYAVYMVLSARKGISAAQLARELGCQPRTAWYMLHRVREACKDGGMFRIELAGTLEVDETYLGGRFRNMSYRDKEQRRLQPNLRKTVVIGTRHRETGQVTAKVVDSPDRESVFGLLAEYIQGGTLIYSDHAPVYGTLPNHDSVNHSAWEFVREEVHTNGIESFWAVVKRAYLGTFHHFSRKHTQRYLNEITARWNLKAQGLGVVGQMKAVVRGMTGKRITYRDLVS